VLESQLPTCSQHTHTHTHTYARAHTHTHTIDKVSRPVVRVPTDEREGLYKLDRVRCSINSHHLIKLQKPTSNIARRRSNHEAKLRGAITNHTLDQTPINPNPMTNPITKPWTQRHKDPDRSKRTEPNDK
jgi:hypothetical protein